MKLKGRLALIAGSIPKCKIVCDIGTDHAYVPIYALLNGLCEKAVVTDIKKGPSLIAKRSIDKHHLGDKIEIRLGDGLDPVGEGEADTVIIAGMGGLMMADILERGKQKATHAGTIILQPMKSPEAVREWLYGNGFVIFDERLCMEGAKLYNVICSRWIGETCKIDIDPLYYYVGRVLLEKGEPLLNELLERKINYFTKVICKRSEADEQEKRRIRDMLEKMKSLKKSLSENTL